jgi:hypothetical protein
VDDEHAISPEMREALYRHTQVVQRVSDLNEEMDGIEGGEVGDSNRASLGQARELVRDSITAIARNELDEAERLLNAATEVIGQFRDSER